MAESTQIIAMDYIHSAKLAAQDDNIELFNELMETLIYMNGGDMIVEADTVIDFSIKRDLRTLDS